MTQPLIPLGFPSNHRAKRDDTKTGTCSQLYEKTAPGSEEPGAVIEAGNDLLSHPAGHYHRRNGLNG
jgi:hypothetical protein